MNQRSILRLAIHLAIIAAALGLGAAVRAMLPSPAASQAEVQTSVSKTSPQIDVPPALAEEPSQPLAHLTDAERSDLRNRIAGIGRSSNPVREQLLLRSRLLAGISSVEDFARALELLDASGAEVYFRQELIADLAERLSLTDPAAATGAMAFIKDRHIRHLATNKIMEAWARRDPEGALTFVSTQSMGIKSSALNSIFRELAKRDPVAAIARINEFKDPGFSYGLERTVLSEWWLKDRDATIAWVNSRSSPGERKQMIRSLLEVAGNRDPEGAWKLIQTLPNEDKPDSWAVGNLFYMWAHKDSPAALNAVLGESDTARRGDMIQRLGRTMKLVDDGHIGEDRGLNLLKSITDEPMRQRFLYGLAEGYLHDGSDRDYKRVLELTAQLTDEKQRLEMMKSIGDGWGRADAPSASEWINTLPPGAERDAVIGEFVRGTFATDPAAAMTWSAAIADEGKRSRRLTELYPKWLKQDAAAASAWLSQQVQLSQTDRAALEASKPAP